MLTKKKTGQYKLTRVANCPCCGHNSTFEHGGTQHWPKRVVEKLGIPETVELYNCGECHSTISETELR